jgi:ribonuclease HII
LDEVGRGALAGPIVAAAVVLPSGFLDAIGEARALIRDSKTLTRPQRRLAAGLIAARALAVRITAIPACEIDERGIGWANREVFRRLILQLAADRYVVDGTLRLALPRERASCVVCQIKADSLVPAVASASIVAKVFRDDLMAGLHTDHPCYGWERNAGYCTAEHVRALRTHGATPHHRAGFVASALAHMPSSEREARLPTADSISQ